jgi:VanZ family protein
MLAIFLSSSRPSSDLPDFNWADVIINKGGHIIGYGMLARSYWYVFGMQENKRWAAWLLALLYALIDELLQSSVPGRQPSRWDVLIFDNLGAIISLWMMSQRIKNG